MAFIHRKFMYESSKVTCILFCNQLDNQGYCSISCNSCPPICYHQNPPPPPPPPPTPPTTFSLNRTKLSTPLTISLVLLATTFSLFCSYTIYKYCTHRRRRRRIRTQTQTELTEETHHLDEVHGSVLDHPIWYIRTVGLEQSIINSIAVCKYKRSDGFVEGTECSVCLNEFQEDETLRLLPKCNHAFHIPCIDTWLRSHTNCPMCRAGIVIRSPSPEQSIDDSGVLEETQMGIADNDGELDEEREDEACELRIGAEEFENGRSVSVDEVQLQPIRRSVSLDCLSVSMISLDIANDIQAQSVGIINTELVKLNESEIGVVSKRLDVNQSLLRLVGSSSIGRSLRRGPDLIKRSMSCSGKVLQSRYSQSQTSVLPP